MPCRDDGPMCPEETDNIDYLICEAVDILETHYLLRSCSKELIKWAKQHEKNEVTRVKKEALAKLSPKERRALGLEKKVDK